MMGSIKPGHMGLDCIKKEAKGEPREKPGNTGPSLYALVSVSMFLP